MSTETEVSTNLNGATHPADERIGEPVRRRRPPLPTQHLVFLVVCSIAILASFLLSVSDSSRVATPWLGVQLPSVCQFRNITGVDCPGCGLTRAFVSIAHGRFAEAWNYNAASGLVFAFVLLQIPYRTIQIWRIRSGLPELYLPRTTNAIVAIVVAAMFLQWTMKLTSYLFG